MLNPIMVTKIGILKLISARYPPTKELILAPIGQSDVCIAVAFFE